MSEQGLAVNDQKFHSIFLNFLHFQNFRVFFLHMGIQGVVQFPEHHLPPVLEILCIAHGITWSQYIYFSLSNQEGVAI